MSAHRYMREMYEQLNFLPTWLPNSRVEVGDVGVLNGQIFERLTSLANLHISFKKRSDRFIADVDAVSRSGARVTVKAAGDATLLEPHLGEAKAGVAVSFDRQGGFVFQASGCESTVVEDKAALARDILDAYEAGEWNEAWVVIDSVISAKTASVLISDSDDASVEFAVSGGGLVTSLPLLSTSMSVVSQRGTVTKFVSAREVTPLFRASRVRKAIWRPWGPPSIGSATRGTDVETDGTDPKVSENTSSLQELTIVEYLGHEPNS